MPIILSAASEIFSAGALSLLQRPAGLYKSSLVQTVRA
jgi:hypothetical protein